MSAVQRGGLSPPSEEEGDVRLNYPVQPVRGFEATGARPKVREA